jgi:hypothetical protein
MPGGSSRSSRALLWAALLGLLAAFGVVWGTRSGPVARVDSMTYLYAARSLTSQGSLRVPVAQWRDADSTAPLGIFPPGYPATLAALHQLGLPPLGAVRAASALAAFVCVFALVLIVGDEGASAGFLMALLLLALPALSQVHLSALSEPLFLAALAATLALMASVPLRPWWYGVTAAIGLIMRYAGVSLVAAASIWAFHRALASPRPASTSRRTHTIRAIRAALFAALPAIAYLIAWQIRTRLEGADTRLATAAWTGALPAAVVQAGYHLVPHLVPVPLPWQWRVWAALPVAAAVLALAIAGWRYSDQAVQERTRRLRTAAALTALCYAAVLVYTRALVDRTIEFDNRILSPLFMSGAVILAVAAIATWRIAGARLAPWARSAAFIVSGLWLAAGILKAVGDPPTAIRTRGDYLSPSWQQAPAAGWLRTTGRGYALFSNDPAAIFFITGRPSRLLPRTLDPDSLRGFDRRLRETRGALLGYPRPYEDMADPGRVASLLKLCPVASSPDRGTVWLPPATPGAECAGGK